ncbi:MAG: nicotinamide mononucleotide transporter [Saprospiraceae bacterium]|nr:nicotinamide mononucleotide transporter [Saprospiraceae bacterium]
MDQYTDTNIKRLAGKKNNILVYPIGIIGVTLAAWVYFFMSRPPLYADAVLNIYYLAMSIYGWINWAKTGSEQRYFYKITYCTLKELVVGVFGFLIAWVLIFLMLILLTDSNTPILDALVSSSALVAMWWMAKRKIENWIAWIFSNIVAIPLNFYKGFMLFTLMYVLFLIMAVSGYQSWKKIQQHI